MKGKCRDFEKKLNDLTSKEKLVSFITTYQFTGKPFCGEFDDTTFRLTRNTPWTSTKAVLIQGTFQRNREGITELEYEVRSKYSRSIVILLSFALLLFVNVPLLAGAEKLLFADLLKINGFFCVGFLFQLVVFHFKKRIVEERFTTEFEIEKTVL